MPASNLDNRVKRNTRLIRNGFPSGFALRLKLCDYKSKIIHKRIMDRFWSDCNTLDRIRPKIPAPILVVSKRKSVGPVETGKSVTPTLTGVVAENFKKLIARDFPDLNDEQLVEKTGISKGTIGRVRRGDSAVTLTTLEKVAAVFKLDPYQLLIPIQDVKNIASVRNTQPNPVDSELVATWPFLSEKTKLRFIDEAVRELKGSSTELSDVLQRLQNSPRLTPK